jgi:hypothetical protein
VETVPGAATVAAEEDEEGEEEVPLGIARVKKSGKGPAAMSSLTSSRLINHEF